MLGLNLRSEFTGRRLSGTTIDFTNRHGTGALDKSATEFLNITYPSIDLIKTIEAVAPGKPRPAVIIGARGRLVVIPAAVKPYMDSSFIASQVFKYLMSLTEIKIATIYSVS
jgi:hypothetical protein